MISSEFPFESRHIEVLGSSMHYVEKGEGNPILFIHGNPTSSYLWRNIIPYAVPHGRAIAVDLIGMGKSDKPDIPYRFEDHVRYIDGFIEALGLKNITFVIHDWGSALGFHYSARNPDNVRGIAFMEAIIRPARWADTSLIERLMFKRLRHPVKGRRMIIDKNFFIKWVVPMMIVRKLSDEEKAAYAAPFLDPASRLPMAVWPKEIPLDGEPADVNEMVDSYWQWLQTSDVPKLMLWAKPGAIVKPAAARELENLLPNLRSIFIGKAKHYVQEDQPEAIGQAISDWLPRLA